MCARFEQLWCANNYLGNRVGVGIGMGWSVAMQPISGAMFERQHDFLDICLHTKVALR